MKKSMTFMCIAFAAIAVFAGFYNATPVTASDIKEKLNNLPNKVPNREQMLKDEFERKPFIQGIKKEQHGNNVVISKTITLNNSPHILKTKSFFQEIDGTFELHYTVIQNLDRYKRSQKQVEVSWEISDKKVDDIKYKIKENVIVLKNSELNELVW